jgi:hypothetical protein
MLSFLFLSKPWYSRLVEDCKNRSTMWRFPGTFSLLYPSWQKLIKKEWSQYSILWEMEDGQTEPMMGWLRFQFPPCNENCISINCWGRSYLAIVTCDTIIPWVLRGGGSARDSGQGIHSLSPYECSWVHCIGPRAELSWEWKGGASTEHHWHLKTEPFPFPFPVIFLCLVWIMIFYFTECKTWVNNRNNKLVFFK